MWLIITQQKSDFFPQALKVAAVSSLHGRIDFPPQNSNAAGRRAAVFSSLLVLLLMRKREIEECRVSYLFREMWGHTGGASRNRKHCKLKGKHPVRAFGKYQHSVRLLRKHLADSRCTTGRRSCLALPPPPRSAQSCCPCRLLHYRCPCVCGHINLLVGWGPHKDRQSGCLFVDIIGLNISLFLIVLRVYIPVYILIHWVLTERWHGQASACFLQAAGAVWLLMQSSKEFTNCIPPALCTEPCLMREYGSCN